MTHYQYQRLAIRLRIAGTSPGLESWVSEANQQTFIAVAMNPRLRQWVSLD